MFLQFLRLSDATAAAFYRYGTFVLFGVLIIQSQTNLNLLPVGIAVRWIANTVFHLFGVTL